ncbi:MAG: acyltransferase [Oscillospiraceae bacterium]|nr:acyltransferase [Oscillospiraceae bacterium]
MRQEKTYYREIDALKGLAMFMVVLGHAIILYPVNLHEDPGSHWLFNFVSSVHVLLFFLLSGLLFSYHGNYGSYLRKKVMRIGIPYVVFNLIDMVPRALLASFFNRPRSISESLLSMLLNGGELWFLRALFLFYVIFVPLALLQDKGLKWKAAVETALFLLAVIPIPNSYRVEYLDLDRIRQCLFFFNTGYLLKGSYPSIRKRIEQTKPGVIFTLAAVLTALWIALLSLKSLRAVPYTVLRVVVALVAVADCFLFTAWKPFNDLFGRFGPWTLQIYLLNSWTMGVSRYVICNLMGATNPSVIILFNMFVDFGLSYLLIKYVLARIKPIRFVMGMPG